MTRDFSSSWEWRTPNSTSLLPASMFNLWFFSRSDFSSDSRDYFSTSNCWTFTGSVEVLHFSFFSIVEKSTLERYFRISERFSKIYWQSLFSFFFWTLCPFWRKAIKTLREFVCRWSRLPEQQWENLEGFSRMGKVFWREKENDLKLVASLRSDELE